MSAPDCEGILGHLFGHKMRARYSTVSEWPNGGGKFEIRNATGPGVESFKNARATYEADVCERCGYTVRHGRES